MAEKENVLPKNLEEILKKYKKDIRPGQENAKILFVPTGSLQLDVALGTGGWPRGRITTIAGKEASGKTTMGYKAIVNAQQMGLRTVLINAENVFDAYRAEQLGMDLDKVVIITPKDLETAADITCDFCAIGEADLIVFDSLAGAPISALNDGKVEEHNVGRKAKIIGNFLTKVTGPAAFNRVAIILINQLRSSMSSDSYGNPIQIMPGGWSIQYSSSIITWFKSFKNDKDNPTGINITAEIKKNNLGVPFKSIEFLLKFDGTIDKENDISEILTDSHYADTLGVIRAGAWYRVPDLFGDQQFQGSAKLFEALREDPTKLKEIENLILDKLTRLNK